MIISDEHSFAFIHIPKCGGTEIKSSLKKYDSYLGFFDGNIDILGSETVDFTHLPMKIIEANFPDLFNKILNYESYAIIRDPVKRFSSGINQYVKSEFGRGIHDFTVPEINNIIDSIIFKLDARKINLDPTLIYFEPQVSFIYIDGIRVVKNIFPIQHMDNLIKDMQENHDVVFESGGVRPKNSSLNYRGSFTRHLAKLIPLGARSSVRRLLPIRLMNLIRSIIYVKALPLPPSSINTVEAFVNRFYKDDILLFQEVLNNEEA